MLHRKSPRIDVICAELRSSKAREIELCAHDPPSSKPSHDSFGGDSIALDSDFFSALEEMWDDKDIESHIGMN